MRSYPVILSFLAVAACGDSSEPIDEPDVDAAVEPEPDATPDDGCDETAQLPAQWRPIDLESTGTVFAETSGAVTTATIDASAGGTSGAADNPYIYIDLSVGEKVAIGDVDALDDASWDVAFKRASIRINGGDSGTGGVTATVVAAASLAEVTAVPTTGFGDDQFVDEGCAFVALPGGEPATALGEWYDYDPTAHTLSPQAEVYVIRVPGDADYKLRILTYYGDEAAPMRGAIYQVEWASM